MTSLLLHAVIAVVSIAPHHRLSRARRVLAALAQAHSTERWIFAEGHGLEGVAETRNTEPHTEMLIATLET